VRIFRLVVVLHGNAVGGGLIAYGNTLMARPCLEPGSNSWAAKANGSLPSFRKSQRFRPPGSPRDGRISDHLDQRDPVSTYRSPRIAWAAPAQHSGSPQAMLWNCPGLRDGKNRVFGYTNMYICDGSMLGGEPRRQTKLAHRRLD
jgi:hypothetical protein